MNIKLLINEINNINENHKNKNQKENFLYNIIDQIEKNNDFRTFLILNIYLKINNFCFIKNNNLNLNTLDKSGRNILFYTSALRMHHKTNLLLSLNVPIQNKYFNQYAYSSFNPGIDNDRNNKIKYNYILLLKIIYWGFNIYNFNFDSDNIVIKAYYKEFIKDYKETIDNYYKYFDFWSRRRNLILIFHRKKNLNIDDKFVPIFTNDLIVNKIKDYL